MIPPGSSKWLRIFQWEKGTFPNVRVNTLFAPCYHCENPACVDAANGAMFKEPKYGAVLIDPAQAKSANVKAGWQACPYGAIAFDSNGPDSTASKCTMCIDRLDQGLKPVCVLSCSVRALDFDTMENLQKKYGASAALEDVPTNTALAPAVVFKSKAAKKTLVAYDAGKALQLMGQRPGGLPAVYSQVSDVTTIPSNMMNKNKLVLKPQTTEELMLRTQDDNS